MVCHLVKELTRWKKLMLARWSTSKYPAQTSFTERLLPRWYSLAKVNSVQQQNCGTQFTPYMALITLKGQLPAFVRLDYLDVCGWDSQTSCKWVKEVDTRNHSLNERVCLRALFDLELSPIYIFYKSYVQLNITNYYKNKSTFTFFYKFKHLKH